MTEFKTLHGEVAISLQTKSLDLLLPHKEKDVLEKAVVGSTHRNLINCVLWNK